MFSHQDLLLISNTLSNIYDWESKSLENDFAIFISHKIPAINYNQAKNLFNEYDNLPAKLKNSPHFDTESFISDFQKQNL